MTGQEVVQRTPTQQLVADVRTPEFQEQVSLALPDTVTPARFVRATATALLQNPDLAKCDRDSVFAAIIKCATDGLIPDGREAALVIYKGKCGYLPMIGGMTKLLAEYGWTLRTKAVYANDEFDYSEEPPTLTHRPVRPGAERGDLYAAYAIATHRDGRRLQTVLHPEDIAKRRAKAQTQAVWNEWPAEMWEKTAGHALARDVPLSEEDRKRLDSILDVTPEKAADLLYGPDGTAHPVTPALTQGDAPTAAAPAVGGAADPGEPEAPGDETGGQQADDTAPLSPPAVSSAPGDPEPVAPTEEQTAFPIPKPVLNELVNGAAAVLVPEVRNIDGEILAAAGKSLAEVAAGPEGPLWIPWSLRQPDGYWPASFREALNLFVEHRAADVWAAYVAERDAA